MTGKGKAKVGTTATLERYGLRKYSEKSSETDKQSGKGRTDMADSTPVERYYYPLDAWADVRSLIISGNWTVRPDTFVWDTGEAFPLLCLDGFVRVIPTDSLSGNPLHVPLSIWPVSTHPYQRPIVYIRRDPGITIRRSAHVRPDGWVSHEYLSMWQWGCTLTGLVCALEGFFRRDIPIELSPPPANPQPQPNMFEMSNKFKDKLRACAPKMVEHVTLSPKFIACLMAYKVLPGSVIRQLGMDKVEHDKRVLTMVMELMKQPDIAYFEFLRALSESDQPAVVGLLKEPT